MFYLKHKGFFFLIYKALSILINMDNYDRGKMPQFLRQP